MAAEILSTRQVINPIMKMFKIAGLHPISNPVLGTFMFWVFSITGVIYTVCSIIKCLQQKTLESFSVTYIDYLVATQTTMKAVTLYIKREKLSELLNTFWNEFWPVDKIKEQTEKHNAAYRQTMKYFKIYRVVLFVCIIQISLNALTMPVRALPYNFYYFGYEHNVLLVSPYYELLYVFECITLSVAYALCLVSHDMFYIAICGCITVQFEMLKYKFRKIGHGDEEESYSILKECVIHHNMLLKFVKDFDKIVTIPILKQYLDAISCMGIYIYLAQKNFHFLYVFSLCTNLSQTLFFSSFGQMIQDRSLEIADAAMESKWHLIPSRRIRQGLILVQVRAQRRTKISAAGFITLSFESFLGMLRAAGSFLAVLRSTKN